MRLRAVGWTVLALTAAFLARVFFLDHLGIRFQAGTIDYFAQLLDPPLLQSRLVESLWYLHAQPPLFNLLTGVALKVSPDHPGAILHVVFLLVSWGTSLFLARIFVRCGLGALFSAGLAIAFTLTPAFVLYENWYFYPHLEQFLLVLTAFALFRSDGSRQGSLILAFASLGALSLLRSLFHPVYFALATAVAFAACDKGHRTKVLRAALVPGLLLILWCTKNAMLFGFWGTSSWVGNSLHRMMTEVLPEETLKAEVAAGRITPLSLEWEFSKPEIYLQILAPPDDRGRGVPALESTGKSRTRENPVNYNHWIYPVASRAYGTAAVHLIRTFPHFYGKAIRWTSARYFDPVTDDDFLAPNRFPLRRAVARFERLEGSAFFRGVGAAVFLAALVLLFRRSATVADRLLLAFAVGTVVWISTLGILVEFGENNRFRFSTIALGWILFAWLLGRIIRTARSRWVQADLLGE